MEQTLQEIDRKKLEIEQREFKWNMIFIDILA